jgi:hypothetical protein
MYLEGLRQGSTSFEKKEQIMERPARRRRLLKDRATVTVTRADLAIPSIHPTARSELVGPVLDVAVPW